MQIIASLERFFSHREISRITVIIGCVGWVAVRRKTLALEPSTILIDTPKRVPQPQVPLVHRTPACAIFHARHSSSRTEQSHLPNGNRADL